MSDVALRDSASVAPPLAAPVRKPRVSRRSLVIGALALIAAAAGVFVIVMPKGSASTDDAYVHADSTTVAPKIRGLIAAILVRDNQVVRRGDPLVQIDAEEFDARVAAASADMASAQAQIEAAAAALTTLDAEERVADANIRAAETAIRSTDAESARAAADKRRYQSLISSGAVAKSEADRALATATAAASETDHSRASLAVSREQAALTRARRAGLFAAQAEAQAALARARANLDLARQDQGHALIRAPIDGTIGDRQAQQGDYVQPGTRLLTIVPTSALYVTANFKETQTGRMEIGQAAEVEVDALPGVRLHGHVESFAPGSGSEFSLLPYEPGTGNFTKIVQRVPVRIRFDPGREDVLRLRPGLSAEVTVALSGK